MCLEHFHVPPSWLIIRDEAGATGSKDVLQDSLRPDLVAHAQVYRHSFAALVLLTGKQLREFEYPEEEYPSFSFPI